MSNREILDVLHAKDVMCESDIANAGDSQQQDFPRKLSLPEAPGVHGGLLRKFVPIQEEGELDQVT